MNIYESINAIMSEVGAIGKDKVNKSQNFKFRGIDDVMNTLHPLLAKHKIFVVPNTLEQTREERVTKGGGNLIFSVCKIQYTFYAEDGSNIQATVIGEGMDSGDKATNKAMAIAFKYALFQVFCIPTEEMKDPDTDTPPESSKKTEIVLTDEQVKELYKIAGDKQVSSLVVDKQVQKKFGCKVQELTLAQYKFMLDGYEKLEVKEGK